MRHHQDSAQSPGLPVSSLSTGTEAKTTLGSPAPDDKDTGSCQSTGFLHPSLLCSVGNYDPAPGWGPEPKPEPCLVRGQILDTRFCSEGHHPAGRHGGHGRVSGKQNVADKAVFVY